MKRCEYCSKSFEPDQATRRFCSRSCSSRDTAHRQWKSGRRKRAAFIDRECEWCGESFRIADQPRFAQRRFCSLGCANSVKRRRRVSKALIESGGRTYIVCRDGSTTAYYRALVEARIGRQLRPDEHVHHINGDRADDRLENLMLLTAAEHTAIHREELIAARWPEKRAVSSERPKDWHEAAAA